MAEGREQSYLTPLEEQILQGADCEDLDDQLLREREAATHRLWTGFQDSATAVAHLFRGELKNVVLYPSSLLCCVCVCVCRLSAANWYSCLGAFP